MMTSPPIALPLRSTRISIVREDARAILAEHYAKSATELNTARLRMARIPMMPR